MRKMNILLITSDQQRWDAVGHQNPVVHTPHLSRLKQRGIAFDRAYTCNPVCTPSRVSILTGHYPSKHGCYTIGTSLPEEYPTVPQLLAQQGYFTALVGKAHFRSCQTPGSFEAIPRIMDRDFYRAWNGPYHGFDYARLAIGHANERHACGMHYGLWLEDQGVDVSRYFGNRKYTDFGTWDLPEEFSNSRWTADETIQAIGLAAQAEKPFFIWSSFQDPHNPCFVSEPWASMYREEDMPVYGLREGAMTDKPPFYSEMAERGNYGDPELYVQNLGHCISPIKFMDKAKKREIFAKYFGMISQMDHQIGRILDELEGKGLLDNTLIVFTSDHGDYMGNHGLWWKGLPAYEDIHRVPFIVCHPECQTKDRQSSALQSLVDLGPTFLSASGLEPPAGMQGIDQTASWLDADAVERTWAIVEFRPTQSAFMQKTFIEKQYKLVVYHDREYGELYDLQSDPDQMANLWSLQEYQQVKNNLLYKFISAEMEKDGMLRQRTASA